MPRDWDAYYRKNDWPTEPVLVVRRFGPLIPEGPVLDLAGGQGRNAVFLAKLGHRVTLLEKSEVALARVQELKRQSGLALEPLSADLELLKPDLPSGSFAGIVQSYFVQRRLLARLPELLMPGGLLLVEGFTQREAKRRGRRSPRYWHDGELKDALPTLQLLAYDEGWIAEAYRVWAVWQKPKPG